MVKNIKYFLSLNNLLEVSGQPQMVTFPLNHCTCINVPLLRAKGVGVGKGDSNHCKAIVGWCQSFEN